ncbi:MAG TPA: molybdopterin cofactor-binding domain-containing protein, partial [Acidimicrobiia bacterium]|nr:molybdopterin cofactor-binding domain-containing protein [Acidimicrobiia bacterium]
MTTEPLIPSFIGAPVQRREDPALITGTADYLDDLTPSGTVHLAIVRSPYAHARVLSVDIEAALESKGVLLVITPDQVSDVVMPPTPNPDRNIPRRFPLVQGTVLMPGDPVAAVVAETAALAKDGADLVFVDYDPLPVVGDVDDAMEAPPLHDGQASNVAYDRTRGDRAQFDAIEGEIRLSGLVDHPRVAPVPMEPRGVLAEWKDGGLVVHLSNQAPHLMQEELARSFQIPVSSVKVMTNFVGGGFGGKFDLAEEEMLVAFAARRFGRPVKWVEGRREHLQ